MSLEQYNENNVYFCEPTNNNIMDGRFIRIIYSTSNFVMNGLYFLINIQFTSTERFHNKYKCVFDPLNQQQLINKIYTIEHEILTKININKLPQYKIFRQFANGNIKICCNYPDKITNRFALKISGLWENEFEYGLTYKFFSI